MKSLLTPQKTLSSWWYGLLAGLRREQGQEFESLPLALARLDHQGAIQQLNKGWEELTGYSAQECLYRAQVSFVHPEDQPLWKQTLVRLAKAPLGAWEQMQLRFLTPGGERRWVEVRIRHYSRGFIVSLGDATLQVQEQQALAASHRSLCNLLDSLPAMVYRCRNNRHWTMEYVSQGCVDLTGYRPDQLINSQVVTFNSLIHPEDRDRVWTEVQQSLQASRPVYLDYRLITAQGTIRTVHERASGIFSDNGDVLGVEGIIFVSPAPH
ncbi:PAS domain-containing protein [Nitrincola iocasae]|uniref:histidine kinase n=1 Tax=Nitrincola iocasae TaxID=2614693 RepID=A0A5J6LIV5_9GAMM|nr:PAS domain-containing protein [Nitrincola iocasae]QEW08398.1 PAS domain-containing protein [Nitrincola iocasae]